MSKMSLFEEPNRVDEPSGTQEYSAVVTKVASNGRPVIVRRNGEDVVAIVPLPFFDKVREFLSREEVEIAAAQIDWSKASTSARPPQSWFDDDDNPFEPEEATP